MSEAPLDSAGEAPPDGAGHTPLDAARDTSLDDARDTSLDDAGVTSRDAERDTPLDAERDAPFDAAREVAFAGVGEVSRVGASPPPSSSRSNSAAASRVLSARLRAVASAPNLALVALGCASLYLYGRVLLLPPGTASIEDFIRLALAQCALYAVAAFVAWRAPSGRATLFVVVAFAALFRLSVLPVEPRLSDDMYRYVWDGRVQSKGINPYRHIPADPALAHLRDEAIYPKINRRDYAPTIYPPAAQAVFLVVTRVSESITWVKAAFVVFEAVAVWAVVALLASWGLPRQRVLLFAWHPLLVWEIASSGHLDALMICFVCLALLARRRGPGGAAGFLLACAALTKFFPVVVAPALYRRWGWRMPAAFAATFVAAYLPYLSVGARRALGFLPAYTDEEGLQSGSRFFILSLARKLFGEHLPGAAYVVFALALLAALAAWALWKRDGDGRAFASRALVLAAAFTVLLSPHYAWYFVWLVPFLPLVAPRVVVPIVYLTAASFMLYRTWLGDGPAEMFAIGAIMYLPFFALCAGAWAWGRIRRTGLAGHA